MGFEVEGLAFGYDTAPVLRGLDFALSPGRFYGLIGPNGCGKSTLIDLLAGHRPPRAGRIRYRGRPLAAHSRRQLAREIALVPQDFYINFPFRAEEVVMMGRYPHMPRFGSPSPGDRRAVAEAMARTDTARLAGRYVTELSGGERQRVVIARAVAQDTPFLFLDEATSNLDINHSLAMLGLLRDGVRRAGRGVLAVFQDLNLAALFCDRLLLLKEGRLLDQGSLADVLTPDNLRRVFGVAARVAHDAFAGAPQVVFRP